MGQLSIQALYKKRRVFLVSAALAGTPQHAASQHSEGALR